MEQNRIPKTMSMYSIDEKHRLLCEIMEESGGELSDEALEPYGLTAEQFEKELQINAENLEETVMSYYTIIKQSEYSIEMLKDEVARLTRNWNSKEKLIDRLKKSLHEATEKYGNIGKTGNHQLKYDKLTLYTKKTKPMVWPDNFDLEATSIVDDKYVKYTVNLKFNSDQIAAITEFLINGDFMFTDTEIEESLVPKVDKAQIKEDLKTDTELAETYKDKGIYIDEDKTCIIIK